MKITKINISSFGALRDREAELAPGMNLIRGDNESGKTSLAMFIKFIFYGLSGRESDAFPTGERKRFINWDTGRAAGSMEFVCDGKPYRIERSLAYIGDGEKVRERKSVIDLSTGSEIKTEGEPGEHFLGIPESVFVNTVFVRQLGSTSVDNGQISSAVENILGSGDEKISVTKVISKLESYRRQLRHKIGSGGELAELESEITSLRAQLREESENNKEIIGKQTELGRAESGMERTKAQIARLERIDIIREDLVAMDDRDSLEKKKRLCRRMSEELERDENAFSEEEIRSGAAQIQGELAALHAARKEAQKRIDELWDKAQADTVTPGECDSVADEARALASAKRSGKAAAISLLLCGAVLLVAAALCFVTDAFPFYIPAAAGGALIVLSAICFAAVSRKGGKLKALLDHWHVASREELEAALAARKDRIYAAMAAAEGIETEKKNVRRMDGALDACRDKARELLSRLASFDTAGAATDTSDGEKTADGTCEGLLASCEDGVKRITARFGERRVRLSELRGECKRDEDALSRYDFKVIDLHVAEFADTPEWEEAKEYAASDRSGERLKKEIDLERRRLAALDKRREECQVYLAGALAKTKSPARIAEELWEKETLHREKSLCYEGVRLAIEALEGSGERLRSQLIPRVTGEASELFSATTLGKYSTLGVSAGFYLAVSDSDTTRSVDYLSAGSADAAYVCLRLALSNVLLKKENVPVVFDESFAKVDESRLGRLFSLLSASDSQSLIFTCRSTEETLTKGAHVIAL